MNIVLTGFMGTGKTSVGKFLAGHLNWQFVDTDEIIERDCGRKISEIFIDRGEKYFRDVESSVVELVSLFNKAVIACGGGVVLRPQNMDALSKNGVIVHLFTRAEKILEYTKTSRNRPILNVPDPLAKIRELMRIREPYYKRCNLSIDTTDVGIEEIAKKIMNHPSVSPCLV